jgi:hypothetical protein
VIACLPGICRARGLDREFGGVVAEHGRDEDFVIFLGFAVFVAREFANCVFPRPDLANLFACWDGAFGLSVGGAFWLRRVNWSYGLPSSPFFLDPF